MTPTPPEAPAAAPAPAPPSRGAALRELAAVFLRLGATAFGGPAAHIALMEDELVTRRRWVTRAAFLDLVAAANLVPGPTSTELAIHLGHLRGGWPGLIVAGVCFILPAALMVGALAAAYVAYGMLPAVGAVMVGLKPAVLAIVGQALWRLGRASLTTALRLALAGASVAAAALGAHELALLAAAGVAMALLTGRRAPPAAAAPLLGAGGALDGAAGAGPGVAAVAGATAAAAASLGGVFLVFLKIGAVLFGSGYVLIAFLRTDLVARLGWVTEAQLLDAVAVGQITPGPLFTTATFLGYLVAGAPGAAVATLGIFLPAFVFVAVSGPLIPWVRRHAAAAAFLDGVVVASLALMAFVTVELARASLVDAPTLILAVLAGGALALRFGPLWVMLGGALAGLALSLA